MHRNANRWWASSCLKGVIYRDSMNWLRYGWDGVFVELRKGDCVTIQGGAGFQICSRKLTYGKGKSYWKVPWEKDIFSSLVLLSSWPSCDLHSWPGEINDFLDGVSPACFLSAWLNTPAGHGPKKWLSDVVSFLSFFSSNFPYSWWIWGRPSEGVALGGHPCIHHMNHPPKKLSKP